MIDELYKVVKYFRVIRRVRRIRYVRRPRRTRKVSSASKKQSSILMQSTVLNLERSELKIKKVDGEAVQKRETSILIIELCFCRKN